jgi:predicted membrane channel-forming protein YqfA (hemolysin III family)
MFHKATFQKINLMFAYSIEIAVIGMVIYWSVLKKNAFREMQTFIILGAWGIVCTSSIINSTYFVGNFSWKHNWREIISLPVCAVVVVLEIKKIWF